MKKIVSMLFVLCVCYGPDMVSAEDKSAVAEILKENLKVGMSEEEALGILSQHGVSSSFVTVEQMRNLSVPKVPDIELLNVKGKYISTIRNIEKSVFVEKNMSVEIYVTYIGTVSKVIIGPIYTGP
jgi:hypothetical protein